MKIDRTFAVATGHPLTSETAAEVLRAGGNAVDSIVAGALMACVCEPVLAGLAGGGAAMVREASGSLHALDFFCDTPRRRRPAHEIDFQEVWADFGTTRQAFHIGAGSMATPAVMPGLFDLHGRAGRMAFRELADPAIRAARDGVVMTANQARLLSIVAPIYRHSAAARAIYATDDAMLPEGASVCNPALADALDALAHEGARLMTEGEIGQAILSLAEEGGHLMPDDLRRYRPVWRKPLEITRGGARVALNPPPAVGGALVAFALSVLDRCPDAMTLARGFDATQDARVEADLALDPAEGAARLADPALIARYRDAVAGRTRARRGTTHLSVLDRAGMGVAMTLTNGEGCGLIAPGTGIMPNNMLGEADLCPLGFGAWPEGTRLSSNITPCAVSWPDGRLAMLGSGGSNRIRTAVAQVILRLVDHDEDPAAAVAAPRLHVEGAMLHTEDRPEGEIAALRAAWPEATVWPEPSMFFGGVHVVMQGPRGARAAGDARRAGTTVLG